MLLSFPFRILLQGLVVLTILLVVVVGWVSSTEQGVVGAQLQVLRWSPIVLLVFLGAVYWAWRWIKPLQSATFPYLGGEWSGTLNFETADGKRGEKPATLRVRHGLFQFQMSLITDQSVSRTLAISPEREPAFGDFRLYYVFEVTRNAGVGADKVYRGTAIVRVDAQTPRIEGDYFTEHKSTGHISFVRGT